MPPTPDPALKDITYQYIRAYAGAQFFYVMSAGPKDKNNSYPSRSIEVYDYDGNAIVRYTFDEAPSPFVVDEVQGIIYGYDYQQPDYWLVYKMHENAR